MKLSRKITALCLCLIIAAGAFYAGAESAQDDIVVVSLGDSYASGEGIEPFYGSDKPMGEKMYDPDWLGHRSENSWSGMLEVPGLDGPLSLHRGIYVKNSDGTFTQTLEGNWFFVAATGAETVHLFQPKTVHVSKKENGKTYKGDATIPPQLEVFEALRQDGRQADYVTVTFGGNDIGFVSIIINMIAGGPVASSLTGKLSEYVQFKSLKDATDDIWDKFYAEGGYRERLLNAYRSICEAAGPQAKVIIAGYPVFLSKSSSSFLFADDDIDLLKESTHRFNAELESIAEELTGEGYKVYFVSVEEAFEGKGAYSGRADEMINRIQFGASEQDPERFGLVSMYSLHPNLLGAKAYAECVQRKIDEIAEGTEN
ncbi:MAG: hypothetical protein II875_12925 [Clostridia bacterium]|nr:hypothetical protein [Clostridia bacterium]